MDTRPVATGGLAYGILTKSGPLRAVDVQGQIALFLFGTVVVEHHAIRAQFLSDLVVRARVVLVALVGVREEPVRLRTFAIRLLSRRRRRRLLVLLRRSPGRAGGRPSPAAVGLAAQQSDCGHGPLYYCTQGVSPRVSPSFAIKRS